MVEHACNPSAQEVEAGRLLAVPNQQGLHSKLLASLGLVVKRCQNKTTEQKQDRTKTKPLWFGGQGWKAVLLNASLQMLQLPVTTYLTGQSFLCHPMLLCCVLTLSVNTPNRLWVFKPRALELGLKDLSGLENCGLRGQVGRKGRECRICGTGPPCLLAPFSLAHVESGHHIYLDQGSRKINWAEQYLPILPKPNSADLQW